MTMHDDNRRMNPDQEWADDRIEAFLEGDLGEADRLRFEALLDIDSWLQNEVDQSLSIHRELAKMDHVEQVVCPDIVTDRVMAHARRDWLTQLPRKLSAGFQRMADAGLRPALAMALLLIVVISSSLVVRPGSQPAGQDAEVARALADVKMALAVLADAGRTTGTAVEQEVFGPLVVRPMSKGMNTVIEN